MKKNNRKPRFKFGSPSLRINFQVAKLLSIHEEFLKRVAEIRHDFGLPNEGLKLNEAELMNWHVNFFRKHDEQYETNLKKYTPLLEQFYKGQITKDELLARRQQLVNELPTYAFEDRIRALTDAFALGEHFFEAIRHFVMTNQVVIPKASYSVTTLPLEMTLNTITITLHARVTQEEQALIFKEAEQKMQHHKFMKYWLRRTGLDDIDESIRIYQISKQKAYNDNHKPIKASISFIAYALHGDKFDEFSAVQKKAELDRIRQILSRTKKYLKEWFPL